MPTLPAVTRRAVTNVWVTRVRDGVVHQLSDDVVTEEPLAIRVAGSGSEPTTISVTMRTPGHDFELAAGFLFSEGIIAGHGELATIEYCQRGDELEQKYNVVTAHIRKSIDLTDFKRNFVTNSSCGVCGTTSIEQLSQLCDPLTVATTIGLGAISGLVDQLRKSQKVFAQTGGLHAAGLFDATTGTLLCIREDVGRHNALDKIVGNALLANRLPLRDHVLMLSGRVGFEMVQKAAMAGIPVVAAVSAPSSLAVRTAEALGVTLIGFVRGQDCTIYTHHERVVMEDRC